MHARLPSSLHALRTIVIVGALGAIAVGCGGSSEGKADTQVDSSAATLDATTTDAATTSAVPETTTTLAPVGLPNQDDVATRLYDAWVANDKVTAATVADPAAVEAMWLAAPGSYYLYNHCSSGEFDTSGCLFRGNPGTIQIDLEKRGENWVVSGAFYSPPGSD
ncbi:MAG: hypothetical protein R2701_07425 [Acidimicrobiales bacterium]|nr:hypothetical protein [Acidimicrobiales bacterium]